MTDLERLEYGDSLVLFHSMCEKYGCRNVLAAFKEYFPEMFKEIVTQASRVDQPKLPALLKHAGPM